MKVEPIEPGPGATAALGAFASRLRPEDLPDDVRAHARRCLLDALGCVIFGTTLPWTRMLIDLAEEEGGNPRAVIAGTRVRTSLRQAVQVMATAGHGFELDDIHTEAHLHCGSLAVPVALALAEADPTIDGAEFLAGIVAGYEVGCRVGLAATGKLFMRGHHFQGTCGVFVAAATAARLLRLDAHQAHQALGIAGSFGSGLMAAQEGAMSKRLHCGHAADMGLTAALLAKRGMTGIDNVLEASYGGFLSTLSGEPDLSRLTVGLGEDFEILTVGFKPYATAASVQSVLHAVDGLMEENGLTADDIAGVHIFCSTMAHRHCAWPYQPGGVTAAQMNMFFTTAAMMHDRAVLAEQFEPARLADPALLALVGRITAEVDPAYDAGGDRSRHAARVTLRLTDGRSLAREMIERPGSPGNPLDDAARLKKVTTLAKPVLGRDALDRLIASVERIEELASASELVAATVPQA